MDTVLVADEMMIREVTMLVLRRINKINDDTARPELVEGRADGSTDSP